MNSLRQNFERTLIYVFVFFTGATGLIYQVTWQKYISHLLGSDSTATAIILGTFLGGLSLGYFLCGRISAKIKRPVRFYAYLEGGIGIWCLLFPGLYKLVMQLTAAWSFAPPITILVQGLLCSVILIGPPTVFMGGTLPLLTKGLAKNIHQATDEHAWLYAINTTGAFFGTLAAGFVLIPGFGLPLTIMGTALVNAGIFLVLFLFFSDMAAVEQNDAGPAQKTGSISPESVYPPVSSRILYAVAFLSGFYVMTLENTLIRVSNISFGSSSYSFSMVVGAFIIAIAIGSFAVRRLGTISSITLILNQFLITVTLFGVYLSLDNWPYWAHLIRTSFQSNVFSFWMYYLNVFGFLFIILILPVGLMGATIPLVFHKLKSELKNVGRHSGFLFSFNTAGNLLGSIIGGSLLFYFFNMAGIFFITVLLSAVSVALLSWSGSRYWRFAGIALVVMVILFQAVHPPLDNRRFAKGLFRHDTPLNYSFDGADAFYSRYLANEKTIYYADGPNSSVAVNEAPVSREKSFKYKTSRSIYVNGKSDSNTVIDMETLKLLAHLPALFSKNLKDVMVIGLGTGVTAGEFTLYPGIEKIDVAEISPFVVKALPYFSQYNHQVQQDKRFKIHIGDALRIIERSQGKWDVIVSEPSNPWVTGVDNLFTREFYEQASKRLTEEGILLQWVHIYSADLKMIGTVVNTVQNVFNYSRVFLATPGDLLIMAYNHPITEQRLAAAENRFNTHPAVKNSLAEINLTTFDTILAREVWTPTYARENFSSSGLQTFEHPILHYMAGKLFFMRAMIAKEELLNYKTGRYYKEYLLARKYKNWGQAGMLPDQLPVILNSLISKKANTRLVMYPFFKIKGYLGDSAGYPIQPSDLQNIRMELRPFYSNTELNEKDWEKIGVKNAGYRGKAVLLLYYIDLHCNWIIPLRLDGLKKILQEGSIKGKDIYEKNWCALQYALLFTDMKMSDQRLINTLLRNEKGEIALYKEDIKLLKTRR